MTPVAIPPLQRLKTEQLNSQTIQRGARQSSVERRIADWTERDFARALWDQDYMPLTQRGRGKPVAR